MNKHLFLKLKEIVIILSLMKIKSNNESKGLHWLPFVNRQSPVYIVNKHFLRKPDR